MAKELAKKEYRFESAFCGEVDAENGIVRGVSVITSGVTARGHDLEVDDTTLLQMLAACEAKGQVPVKWNHKTGADAVNGYLKNFRIDGKKLKADWHMLKSHERYEHALELAETMPSCIGLSASFMGKDEEIGGRKHARCEEVVSVDLVSTPAANPDGLFEAKTSSVDSKGNNVMDNEQFDKLEKMLTALGGQVQSFGTRLDAVEQQSHQFSAVLDGLDDDPEEPENEEPENEEPTDLEAGGLAGAITYLSQKIHAMEDAKEQDQVDYAFEQIESRMTELMEINEQLLAENAALAEGIREFEAMTNAQVHFSAGTDGLEVHIEGGAAGKGAAALTEFEARVEQLVKGGKEKTEAILFAVKEDRGRHQKHLQAMQERNTRTL